MSDTAPITRHVVVISGFRQRHGRGTTGVDGIWFRLRWMLDGGDTQIWLKRWDDDFSELAAVIDGYRFNRHVEVVIVGYSWGVGNGAVKLCRELQQYDIKVRYLYSIDGVYRSPWFGFKWRSMLRRERAIAPKIVVPANVETVMFWRQDRNVPQGHHLIAEADQNVTRVIPGNEQDGLIENVTHQMIDNNAAIRDQILEHLEAW